MLTHPSAQEYRLSVLIKLKLRVIIPISLKLELRIRKLVNLSKNSHPRDHTASPGVRGIDGVPIIIAKLWEFSCWKTSKYQITSWEETTCPLG